MLRKTRTAFAATPLQKKNFFKKQKSWCWQGCGGDCRVQNLCDRHPFLSKGWLFFCLWWAVLRSAPSLSNNWWCVKRGKTPKPRTFAFISPHCRTIAQPCDENSNFLLIRLVFQPNCNLILQLSCDLLQTEKKVGISVKVHTVMQQKESKCPEL